MAHDASENGLGLIEDSKTETQPSRGNQNDVPESSSFHAALLGSVFQINSVILDITPRDLLI